MSRPLPETHIQILSSLTEFPEGLTTGQIATVAKQKRFFIFRNSAWISTGIFYLRKQALVTTADVPGGKIHRITDQGRGRLADATGEHRIKSEPEARYDDEIADVLAQIRRDLEPLLSDSETKTGDEK